MGFLENINSRIKQNPSAIKTVQGTQAEINTLKADLISEGVLAPVVVFNTTEQKYVFWDSIIQEFRSIKTSKIVSSWTFDGTYTTSSTSFGTVPLNLLIPNKTGVGGIGSPFLKGTLFVEIATTGGATAEVRLIDSAGANVFTMPISGGAFAIYSGGAFNINAGYYRIQIRRVGGTGSDDVDIRSASLTLEQTDTNEA